MRFRKFKCSAIYTAIIVQLSVSTFGMAGVAHANSDTAQANGKAYDKTSNAQHFGQNQLTSLAGQQAESWLNSFGGSSRVSIGADQRFSDYNYAGDVLVPLFDSRNLLVFSQTGVRHADERTTGNIGLGMRYFADGWMTGYNAFFDNDFSGNNRRVGVGAEIWSEAIRLAANGYFGLNGWHQSKFLADYDERPADGWDIELSSWLPVYPQLGGKVKYEQYYGDNVALLSRGTLQKNPSAATIGLNWMPVPLLAFEAGHRKSMQSGEDTTIGLNLNWNFGRSLDWHLSPDAVADQRSLAGSRYELVARNNEIVMDYRQQTVISFSLANAVKGTEGTTQSLGVSVWAKHGLDKIVWESAALEAAGGSIIGSGKNSALVLPAYQEGASNRYTLSGVAYDTKGKVSPRAQVQITVEKSEQVIPEEPGQPVPDAGQTVISISPDSLVADGSATAVVTVELNDQDGKPLSGEADNLRLEAAMQNTLQRTNTGVVIGQFREDAPGRYRVDVTAGTQPGQVTLALYHRNTQLKQQTLTLTAQEAEVAVPTKIELEATRQQTTAGNNLTFVAVVTDQYGKRMKGIKVRFADQQGNDFLLTDNGLTNKDGGVTAVLPNVEKAGIYTVISYVGELASNPVSVEVIADVASAKIESGTYRGENGTFRQGNAGSTKNALFLITLVDKYGNPLKDIKGLTFKEARNYDQQIVVTSKVSHEGLGLVRGTVAMANTHTPQNKKTVYYIYPLINGVRAGTTSMSVTFDAE